MFREAVRGVEWVWISHHHLDHHGGLASLVATRWREFGLLTRVFAPSSVIAFLRQVSGVLLPGWEKDGDVRWLFPNAEAPRALEKDVIAVSPTNHCAESWAIAVRCGGMEEEGGVGFSLSFFLSSFLFGSAPHPHAHF